MVRVIDSFTGSYLFLSNFYRHPICYHAVDFPSSEHAFQAEKTLSRSERLEIAGYQYTENGWPFVRELTPAQAKWYGRNRITKRANWERIKVRVMYEILQIKFNDGRLAQLLRDTQPADLIEGNWWHDNFWGNCTCRRALCGSLAGQNQLGRLLMRIRNEKHWGQ